MNTSEFQAVAVGIRNALDDAGHFFTIRPEDGNYASVVLVTPDWHEAGIFLTTDDKKMHAHHHWGGLRGWKPYDSEVPSIAMSIAKSPADMAKDIRNRFLPAWHAEVEKATRRYEELNQMRWEAIEIARRMVRASDGALKADDPRDETEVSIYVHSTASATRHVRMQVWHDHINMEGITISEAEANQTLAILGLQA